MASYCDAEEAVCAEIIGVEEYVPRKVKIGDHYPLTLHIADHSKKPWKWVRAKNKFNTLAEAKSALVRILKSNPYLMPEEDK